VYCISDSSNGYCSCGSSNNDDDRSEDEDYDPESSGSDSDGNQEKDCDTDPGAGSSDDAAAALRTYAEKPAGATMERTQAVAAKVVQQKAVAASNAAQQTARGRRLRE
jgi:hypothetical protein